MNNTQINSTDLKHGKRMARIRTGTDRISMINIRKHIEFFKLSELEQRYGSSQHQNCKTN